MILMGIMTGLQPTKAKLEPLMATLVGQLDWAEIMKYYGYQVAANMEKEGLTEV